MPRLNPPKPKEVPEYRNYATLVGDVLPNENWVIPTHLRVDGANPRTDTGLIQLQLNEEETFMFSRSGLNIGVPVEKIPLIIDALSELGFTTDLQILETGEKDGTEPEHYSRSDYSILLSKIGPSAYLAKFNPSLTKRYPA